MFTFERWKLLIQECDVIIKIICVCGGGSGGGKEFLLNLWFGTQLILMFTFPSKFGVPSYPEMSNMNPDMYMCLLKIFYILLLLGSESHLKMFQFANIWLKSFLYVPPQVNINFVNSVFEFS